VAKDAALSSGENYSMRKTLQSVKDNCNFREVMKISRRFSENGGDPSSNLGRSISYF
jgi:hypothetical protein